MNSTHQLHKLSERELVSLCLQHQRSAWEEFFRRYSKVLKKAIRRTFIACGARDYARDIDNILDIHAVLVEKLYAKGALTKCPDPSGLPSWLIKISVNQTYDWLKKRGRIKNLPTEKEQQFLKRLSTPLGEDQDFTLEDIIEDEDSDLFRQLQQTYYQLYVECVIDQLADIKNITYRWILRLSILGQLALTDEELESLHIISPLQHNEFIERINSLESLLTEKERNRQDDLGRTVVYWHQLRVIEYKMTQLQKDIFTDHSLELMKLNKEWMEIETRKDAMLAGCHALPRPSNKEIAEIIGIPEEQCGNVSKYITRARDDLRKKMSAISDIQ